MMYCLGEVVRQLGPRHRPLRGLQAHRSQRLPPRLRHCLCCMGGKRSRGARDACLMAALQQCQSRALQKCLQVITTSCLHQPC